MRADDYQRPSINWTEVTLLTISALSSLALVAAAF